MKIIEAIPEADRPIFLWLKYHLRRPSEACVLKWWDYDEINKVFVIRRSLSDRQVVESTKTRAVHIIPCHSAFVPVLKRIERTESPYIFINQRSRKNDGRYTNESLNIIWKKACAKVGEDIDMYSGLKHSSCSQYLNERGLSFSELQILTDHANPESVKRYGKVEIERKRQLMETMRTTPKLLRIENDTLKTLK